MTPAQLCSVWWLYVERATSTSISNVTVDEPFCRHSPWRSCPGLDSSYIVAHIIASFLTFSTVFYHKYEKRYVIPELSCGLPLSQLIWRYRLSGGHQTLMTIQWLLNQSLWCSSSLWFIALLLLLLTRHSLPSQVGESLICCSIYYDTIQLCSTEWLPDRCHFTWFTDNSVYLFGDFVDLRSGLIYQELRLISCGGVAMRVLNSHHIAIALHSRLSSFPEVI